MYFARKAGLVILTPLLPVLLFATAFNFGLVHTLSNPASVKKIIADSGIYDNGVASALDQSKSNSSDGLNLSDPTIKEAASKAITPAVLQNSINQIVDGIYSWLDGKTPQPNFNVDLSGPKATFADSVGSAAQAKAATLPVCTTVSSSTSLDVFSATCLPKGITAVAAGQDAKNQILKGGQGFLDNPVITPSTIKSGNSDKSIFADKLKNVPTQYQRIKETPYILALLAVLVGSALVFLRSSWQKGLRHVGIVLVVSGALMLGFSYGLNWGINNKLVPNLKFSSTLLQTDAKSLIKDLSGAIAKNYYLFGALYGLLGLAAIATPIVLDKRNGRTKQPPAKEVSPAQEPEIKEPQEPASQTKEESKPTKKIKIT